MQPNNSSFSEMTSQAYLDLFVTPFWLNHMQRQASDDVVIFGQMQDDVEHCAVDEKGLYENLVRLELTRFVDAVLKFDKNFIVGYKFTTPAAKTTFIDWATTTALFNLVILEPEPSREISFIFNSFSFGFKKEYLQNQLGDQARVTAFKYLTQPFGDGEIKINAVKFTLKIKPDLDLLKFKCFIRHNLLNYQLSSKALPSICTLCRERGHTRDTCEYKWCTPCNTKVAAIHICPVKTNTAPQQSSITPDSNSDTEPLENDPPQRAEQSTPAVQPSNQRATTLKNKKSSKKATIKKIIPQDIDSDNDDNPPESEPDDTAMECTKTNTKRKHAEVFPSTSGEDSNIKTRASTQTYRNNVKQQ